jgi:hypothetical protein
MGTVQTLFMNGGHLDLQNPKKGPDDPTYKAAQSYGARDSTANKHFLFNLNVVRP